jgi:hypothetical protein
LGIDVRDLLDWPAWLVEAWQTYFDREPPVGERIEQLVALHATRWFNAHRPKSTAEQTYTELLPHRTAWQAYDDAQTTTGDESGGVQPIFSR